MINLMVVNANLVTSLTEFTGRIQIFQGTWTYAVVPGSLADLFAMVADGNVGEDNLNGSWHNRLIQLLQDHSETIPSSLWQCPGDDGDCGSSLVREITQYSEWSRDINDYWGAFLAPALGENTLLPVTLLVLEHCHLQSLGEIRSGNPSFRDDLGDLTGLRRNWR
ncbi:hypothetical protein BJ085DRAFT_27492 [Dimargaris cristalligena]|uniref:Uncharacterized protein n=1 Tax=Dimargaris cristalligena TaxID=215637 RepID=A0A4Q0A3B6_9FUNG|nr:hypothetical protein BJ085DRAFT_27492 [Dimargaris cristalligena]|eukprot:RKP39750.1 hypothetical protein BJ085DRAFT_27492 [Dimargaris cristalligena]